jgi:hypothetical protein
MRTTVLHVYPVYCDTLRIPVYNGDNTPAQSETTKNLQDFNSYSMNSKMIAEDVSVLLTIVSPITTTFS